MAKIKLMGGGASGQVIDFGDKALPDKIEYTARVADLIDGKDYEGIYIKTDKTIIGMTVYRYEGKDNGNG